MNISFDFENIHFNIVIEKSNNFIPHPHSYNLGKLEKQALKNNMVSFYDVTIHSSKNNEKMTHIRPALLLSTDKDNWPEELEDTLFEDDEISKIVTHWNYSNSNGGPHWKL